MFVNHCTEFATDCLYSNSAGKFNRGPHLAWQCRYCIVRSEARSCHHHPPFCHWLAGAPLSPSTICVGQAYGWGLRGSTKLLPITFALTHVVLLSIVGISSLSLRNCRGLWGHRETSCGPLHPDPAPAFLKPMDAPAQTFPLAIYIFPGTSHESWQ